MPSRRQFLGGGLAALAWGLSGRRAWALPTFPPPCPQTGAAALAGTNPILAIPNHPTSTMVDGMPFAAWFTGDDFDNNSIPFHFIGDYGSFPPPQESVDVAIVGGGISGLSAALLLREYRPVVFELRDRFGGNAMGESWRGDSYPIGSAYVIVPDEGSFLERFYRRLGLDRIARVSEPPDPVVIDGQLRDDFYNGAGMSPAHQLAFQRYAEVVADMAENNYPEIPLSDDPVAAASVRELDRTTFRADIEQRMGMPMPPLLAAALQAYCYSSFGAGFDELSAASGWNFLAAEEYGRWVFPGGNAALVQALWNKLRRLEQHVPAACRPRYLRARCRVIDVRYNADRVQVTYLDRENQLRSLLAKHVVMAGAKHICKYMIHDLQTLDPAKYDAMSQVDSSAYLIANVLLTQPIERDFYDAFLVENDQFPVEPYGLSDRLGVVDMLTGTFAERGRRSRDVLSLFWPLPFPTARYTLLTADPWREYATRLVPQIRHMLGILDLPESAVRQVRMTRWGHALPIAAVGLIADGVTDQLIRPFGERVHFANQDNWALPAVENSILEAKRVADVIAASLG